MELFKRDNKLIYAVVHRDSGKTYVGKTIKTLEQRKRGHLRSARWKSDTHFHRALRRYETSAFEWFVVEDDVQDLDEAECFYISYLLSLGATLYNMTPGGDGVQEQGETYHNAMRSYWTEEKREQQAQRISGDNNPMRDPVVVEHARVAISRGCLGLKKSEDHCFNISRSKKGHLNPMFGKRGSQVGTALDIEKCVRIRDRLLNNETVASVAREERVTRKVVRDIKNGVHWSCQGQRPNVLT